jgi:hypothetical protein
MKNINIIFVAILSLYVAGCQSDSSELPAYSCSFECLASNPVISTNTISAATGGTVTVDIELTGNISNVNGIFVQFKGVDSGMYVSGASLLSPTTTANSISVTVPAGTTPGTYYPMIVLTVANPSSGQSWYHFNEGFSVTNYTYQERTGSGDSFMVSPFTIPKIVVN